MKIVSYNINLSNSKKIETLLEENADVYVVPEIAEEDLPSGFSKEWTGVHYDKPFMGTKSKGLGVIWRNDKGKFLEKEYNEKLTYAIPIVYDNIFILGFWPTKKPAEKTNYTKIATAIIEYYTPLIQQYDKCIITGDFNLYKSKEADIFKINKILNKLGLESIYHSRTGESFGSEIKATYYHKPMKDKPFFLDYTFANFSAESFVLKDFGRDFSDHVGQIVEV